ncbi:helix-turn-helix domain-containing protein [Streptomyces sp. NPDC093093]|uniref:helix-turn-helix domain-containing protein n=1 Tax=Streptomyces sp. NPDC093093 TaxID=3366025 RepID=UPI00381F5A4D
MRSDETVRQRFGRLIASAARATGRYDIDSHGGKAALARAAGLSESTMGRVLRGESIPDPRFFEPLAKAVDVDVMDLLVEAGIVSPETLSTPAQTGAAEVGSRSITLDEAADALGIRTAVGRELFAAAVERLQRTERTERATDEDGGDATAHA